jgi:hypothetical protein
MRLVSVLIYLQNHHHDGDFDCQNRNCLLISPMDRTHATESQRYRSRVSVRGWVSGNRNEGEFGPTHSRAEISVRWDRCWLGKPYLNRL